MTKYIIRNDAYIPGVALISNRMFNQRFREDEKLWYRHYVAGIVWCSQAIPAKFKNDHTSKNKKSIDSETLQHATLYDSMS